jgi:hypothetical protein
MKRNILVIGIVFGLFGWSCSKVDTQTQQQGLKQSIEQGTTAINAAIGKITQTKGYQILSLGANPIAKDCDSGNFF